MTKSIKTLLAIGLLATSQFASAAAILQGQQNGSLQINYFEPLGQSFTAEDAYVSFGFSYLVMNDGYEVSDLTLNLLEGDGLGGSVLSSTTFSLAPAYTGFFDVDLSSVALNVGSKYTVTVSAVGDSPYWGMNFSTGQNADNYTGGGIVTGTPSGLTDLGDITRMDTMFRVTPQRAPAGVPEPATLALLGIGMLGLAASRRRRSI